MAFLISGYLLLAVFFGLEFFGRRGKEAREIKTAASTWNTSILIGALYPISILLPLILNYFGIGRIEKNVLAGSIGIGLMTLGLGIRFWAMVTLGRFYTRALITSADQHIIQNGPYRFIRHPGYLGTLLIWIGLQSSLANWIAILAVLFLMGFAYGWRIRTEEQMLLERFGEEYRVYKKRSWRLIPPVL